MEGIAVTVHCSEQLPIAKERKGKLCSERF